MKRRGYKKVVLLKWEKQRNTEGVKLSIKQKS